MHETLPKGDPRAAEAARKLDDVLSWTLVMLQAARSTCARRTPPGHCGQPLLAPLQRARQELRRATGRVIPPSALCRQFTDTSPG